MHPETLPVEPTKAESRGSVTASGYYQLLPTSLEDQAEHSRHILETHLLKTTYYY
jgi:muramidase (phage lysozyme)